MKTLEKLNFKPENLIQIQELKQLRGGTEIPYQDCKLYYDSEFISNIQWPGETPPMAAADCTSWHQGSPMFSEHNWCDCGC
jgi:hypothetical protein